MIKVIFTSVVFKFFLFISATSMKEFGTFYIPQNEVFELNLMDYFDGEELEFYLPQEHTNEIQIVSSENLQLKAYFKLNSIASSQPTQVLSLKIDWNQILIIAANSNKIMTLVYDIFSDTIAFGSEIEIITGYSFVHIIQIEKLLINEKYNLLILTKSGNGEGVYDLYVMPIVNCLESYEYLYMSLPELKDADSVVLSVTEQDNFFGIIIAHSTSFDRAKAIYVFEIDNYFNITLFQKISEYEINDDSMKISFNPIKIYISVNRLLILDQYYGLMVYPLGESIPVAILKNLDLSRYGKMHGILITNAEYIYIICDKGILKIKRISQIDIYGIKDFITFDSETIIKATEYKSHILCLAQKGNQSIIYLIDGSKIIGKKIVNKVEWPGNDWDSSGNIFYGSGDSLSLITCDNDGLRVFSIGVGHPKLVINTKREKMNLSAIAKDKNNLKSENYLKIINLPETPEIYMIDGFKVFDNSNLLLNKHFSSLKENFNVFAEDYFSGLNLTFYLEAANIPPGLSVFIDPIPKYQFFEKIELESHINNVFLYSNLLYVLKNDGIFLYDKISKSLNLLIEKSNPGYLGRSGNGLIVLSKTEHNESIIHSFIYSKLKEEGKSPIKCDFFHALGIWLVCADQLQVDIYKISDNKYDLIESFKEFSPGKELHIFDVKFLEFPLTSYSSELFIVDRSSGIIQITFENSILKRKIKSLDKIQGLVKFLVTEAYYFMIRRDKIDVLDKNYNKLKEWAMPKGLINDAQTSGNLLYLHINDMLYIYRVNRSYLSKLFTSFYFHPLDKFILDYKSLIYNHLASIHKNTIYLYEINCSIGNSVKTSCPSNFIVSVSINNYQALSFKNSVIDLKLTAKNSINYKEVKIQVNFSDTGLIVQSNSKSSVSEINYKSLYILELFKYFSGGNVQYRLELDPNDLDYLPYEISPKIKEVANIYIEDSISQCISIEGTNKIICLQINRLLIIDFDASTLKLTTEFESPFGYYDTTGAFECKSIVFIKSIGHRILFATSCLNFDQGEYPVNAIPNQSIFLGEYNLQAKKIERFFRKIIGGSNLNNLIAISLDSKRFLLLALSAEYIDIVEDFIYPYIIVFSGEYTLLSLKIDNVSIIDILTLNCGTFSIESIDVAYINNKLGIYIVDSGLRILNYDPTNSIILKQIVIDFKNKISNLGIAYNNLFLIFDKSIDQYDISKPEEPQLLRKLYNPRNGDQLNLSPTIIFNNYKNLDLMVIRDYSKYSGRITYKIYDLNTESKSSLFHEFIAEKEQNYGHNLIFINPSTFVLQNKANALEYFKLQKPKIEFRALTEIEYDKIISERGSNEFNMSLTAFNNYSNISVHSTLKRVKSIAEPEKSLEWIWLWLLLICLIIFIGLIGLIYCANQYKNQQRMKLLGNENELVHISNLN